MKAELEHHYAWTTKAYLKTEERAEDKKKQLWITITFKLLNQAK